MPFLIEIDPRGFLRATASGVITADDLLKLHADLAARAATNDRCLIDLTAAEDSQLAGPTVHKLAQLPPKFARLAVAAKPGVGHGLARSYQAASTLARPIGAFSSTDTAIMWLTKGLAQKP